MYFSCRLVFTVLALTASVPHIILLFLRRPEVVAVWFNPFLVVCWFGLAVADVAWLQASSFLFVLSNVTAWLAFLVYLAGTIVASIFTCCRPAVHHSSRSQFSPPTIYAPSVPNASHGAPMTFPPQTMAPPSTSFQRAAPTSPQNPPPSKGPQGYPLGKPTSVWYRYGSRCYRRAMYFCRMWMRPKPMRSGGY